MKFIPSDIPRDTKNQDKQYKVRLYNHFCSRKAVSVTNSLCVCSLRHPGYTSLRHTVIRDVTALLYFFTLSHKRHDLKKKILNIKRVFGFSLQLVSNVSHSNKELREIWSKMYAALHKKYQLFLSDFGTWNLYRFSKNAYKYKFHKNPSTGSGVLPYKRKQEDMTKLTVVFRNFPNAPTNGNMCSVATLLSFWCHILYILKHTHTQIIRQPTKRKSADRQ